MFQILNWFLSELLTQQKIENNKENWIDVESLLPYDLIDHWILMIIKTVNFWEQKRNRENRLKVPFMKTFEVWFVFCGYVFVYVCVCTLITFVFLKL